MVFASIDQALQNATPTLFQKKKPREEKASDWDDSVRDPWDAREVFEMIREIRDPEHPMSLEELGVVQVLAFLKINLWHTVLLGGAYNGQRWEKWDRSDFYTDDPTLLDGDADRIIHLSEVDPLPAKKVQSQPFNNAWNTRPGNFGNCGRRIKVSFRSIK